MILLPTRMTPRRFLQLPTTRPMPAQAALSRYILLARVARLKIKFQSILRGRMLLPEAREGETTTQTMTTTPSSRKYILSARLPQAATVVVVADPRTVARPIRRELRVGRREMARMTTTKTKQVFQHRSAARSRRPMAQRMGQQARSLPIIAICSAQQPPHQNSVSWQRKGTYTPCCHRIIRGPERRIQHNQESTGEISFRQSQSTPNLQKGEWSLTRGAHEWTPILNNSIRTSSL